MGGPDYVAIVQNASDVFVHQFFTQGAWKLMTLFIAVRWWRFLFDLLIKLAMSLGHGLQVNLFTWQDPMNLPINSPLDPEVIAYAEDVRRKRREKAEREALHARAVKENLL